MEDKEYENYMEDYETVSTTTGWKVGEGGKEGERGSFRNFIIIVPMVFILPVLIYVMGSATLGIIDNINIKVQDITVAGYNKDNLQEFTVVGKNSGTQGLYDTRVNYLSIESETAQIDIKVSLDIYREFKTGDKINFYVEEGNRYLLHESNRLMLIFE